MTKLKNSLDCYKQPIIVYLFYVTKVAVPFHL